MNSDCHVLFQPSAGKFIGKSLPILESHLTFFFGHAEAAVTFVSAWKSPFGATRVKHCWGTSKDVRTLETSKSSRNIKGVSNATALLGLAPRHLNPSSTACLQLQHHRSPFSAARQLLSSSGLHVLRLPYRKYR